MAGVGRRVRRHGETALAPGFSARQRALEGAPKLGRQRVVQNGVDGAETEQQTASTNIIRLLSLPNPSANCFFVAGVTRVAMRAPNWKNSPERISDHPLPCFISSFLRLDRLFFCYVN
jgi:hypothetical protein